MFDKLIYKIKYIILTLIYFCFHFIHRLLSAFIKPTNQVLFNAYKNFRYSDNPKFISEKLHEINPRIKIVWLKDKQATIHFPDYVKVVEFDYKKFLYLFYIYSKSKIIVGCDYYSNIFYKSNNQYYINTWHGGLGIKKIGKDLNTYYSRAITPYTYKKLSKDVDLFISNCDHISNLFRNSFNYKGNILKSGYPKNDKLINSNYSYYKEKILNFYNLNKDTKIFLYAPTFRPHNFVNKSYYEKIYSLDCSKLYNELNNKYHSNWIILVRLHQAILFRLDFDKMYNDKVIDATNYPDMQELIMGCDILVSDFSSCLFDGLLIGKQSHIYAVDYSFYSEKVGLYYKIEELPFPVSLSFDELLQNISNYDSNVYTTKWENFSVKEGLYEPGNASMTIAELINNMLKD